MGVLVHGVDPVEDIIDMLDAEHNTQATMALNALDRLSESLERARVAIRLAKNNKPFRPDDLILNSQHSTEAVAWAAKFHATQFQYTVAKKIKEEVK